MLERGGRRPAGAARDPQGGRPGQERAAAAARALRARGVPLDPEDRDGPAPLDAPGRRRRRHPRTRPRRLSALRRGHAASSRTGHDSVKPAHARPSRGRGCGAAPPRVTPRLPGSAQPGAWREDRVDVSTPQSVSGPRTGAGSGAAVLILLAARWPRCSCCSAPPASARRHAVPALADGGVHRRHPAHRGRRRCPASKLTVTDARRATSRPSPPATTASGTSTVKEEGTYNVTIDEATLPEGRASPRARSPSTAKFGATAPALIDGPHLVVRRQRRASSTSWSRARPTGCASACCWPWPRSGCR